MATQCVEYQRCMARWLKYGRSLCSEPSGDRQRCCASVVLAERIAGLIRRICGDPPPGSMLWDAEALSAWDEAITGACQRSDWAEVKRRLEEFERWVEEAKRR